MVDVGAVPRRSVVQNVAPDNRVAPSHQSASHAAELVEKNGAADRFAKSGRVGRCTRRGSAKPGVARSAALRPAIRARITSDARVRHTWHWSLATAAASGIVLVLLWPNREAPVDVAVSRAAVTTSVSPVELDPSIVPSSTVGEARATGHLVAPATTTRGAQNVTEELSVDSLDVAALAVQELQVPTLTVDAMTIAPLSTP
jgi:hypothetical protein